MTGAIILTVLAVVASAGDAWTTSRVRQIGIDTGHDWKEGNPVARFLFRLLGFRPYLLKALLFVPLSTYAALYGFEFYAVVQALWLGTGAFATGWNYQIYKRRKEKWAPE